MPPPPSRASKRTSAAGFNPAGFSFSGSDVSAGGSGALPVHLLLSVAQTKTIRKVYGGKYAECVL